MPTNEHAQNCAIRTRGTKSLNVADRNPVEPSNSTRRGPLSNMGVNAFNNIIQSRTSLMVRREDVAMK